MRMPHGIALTTTTAGTGAHPAHICMGTGPTPATTAPGLGSPLPHLLRYAHGHASFLFNIDTDEGERSDVAVRA
jgi:hypothetical protein